MELEATPSPPNAALEPSGGAPMRSVKHGAVWTLLGYGAGQVIRFASTLVLTRLLIKDDFGTASLAFSFLTGINMVGDLGIWASVIQNPNGQQRRFRNTAWTLQWIRSLILATTAFLIAPSVGDYYEHSELGSMIRWAALSMLVTNLAPTSFLVAGRKMELAKTAAVELITQATATAVTICLALSRPGPEVLIYGALAGSCARFALIVRVFGAGDWFAWEREALRAILAYGVWTALSSMVFFAVGQADRLVFGTLVSRDLLGLYAISATLVTIPGEVLGRLVASVYFPVMSRAAARGSIDPREFHRCRVPLFGLGGFAIACLCGGAPNVVGVLYPTDYVDAVWMVQILCFGLWTTSVLESPRTTSLLALGHSRWLFLTGLGKLAGMPVLIPLGYAWLGFPGAMLGYAAADLLRLAVSIMGCRWHGLRDYGTDVVMTVWVAATALLGSGVCTLVTSALDGAVHPRLGHALSGFSVAIAVGLAWLPCLLRSFREGRQLQRSGL